MTTSEPHKHSKNRQQQSQATKPAEAEVAASSEVAEDIMETEPTNNRIAEDRNRADDPTAVKGPKADTDQAHGTEEDATDAATLIKALVQQSTRNAQSA